MALTKAEEMAAKAKRIAERNAAKTAGTPAPETPITTVANPHAKLIRSTVDLLPVRHADLKTWCGDMAVDIGVSRITTQDVFRVLVTRLLTDPNLARQVREDLRVEKQK
ncbi:MAG: hypothetical protein ABIQ18_32030 [Umezawaea sp.]